MRIFNLLYKINNKKHNLVPYLYSIGNVTANAEQQIIDLTIPTGQVINELENKVG